MVLLEVMSFTPDTKTLYFLKHLGFNPDAIKTLSREFGDNQSACETDLTSQLFKRYCISQQYRFLSVLPENFLNMPGRWKPGAEALEHLRNADIHESLKCTLVEEFIIYQNESRSFLASWDRAFIDFVDRQVLFARKAYNDRVAKLAKSIGIQLKT